jgi:hypothetical protein
MEAQERAELIRKGNQAFNEKNYTQARELFTKAGYKDGLIRLGDYYMYDRRLPLLAYGYYKRAGAKNKIEDLHRRMIGAFSQWIGEDKLKEESRKMLHPNTGKPIEVDSDGMVRVPVASELLKQAKQILAEK